MNKKLMISGFGFVLATFAMGGAAFAQDSLSNESLTAETISEESLHSDPLEKDGEKKMKELPPVKDKEGRGKTSNRKHRMQKDFDKDEAKEDSSSRPRNFGKMKARGKENAKAKPNDGEDTKCENPKNKRPRSFKNGDCNNGGYKNKNTDKKDKNRADRKKPDGRNFPDRRFKKDGDNATGTSSAGSEENNVSPDGRKERKNRPGRGPKPKDVPADEMPEDVINNAEEGASEESLM